MNARSNPSLRFRALLVVASLAGWHATRCSTALAHNGEAPPTPPAMSPVAVNIKEAPPPPRWTWVYWWEANRDRFLTTPSQSAGSVQDADPAQLEKLRADAAQELVRAVESGGTLAAEAAMALGKMHQAPSLATLKKLVDRADAARGRIPVVLGMGLLGSPEAEAALVAYRPPRVEDEAAPLAAIGLLPTIQEATLRVLRKAIDSNQPGTATAACFALRQHHDKNNVAYYRGLLRSNESTWVASEALLGMGKTHEREAVGLLEHVLFGDPAASRDVMAWGTLNRMREQRMAAAQAEDTRDRYNKSFEGYKKEFERWKQRNPNTKFDKTRAGRKDVVDGGEITVGEEFRELAWLRSSAAIALGEAAQPRAGEVLLTFISPTRRDTDVYLVAPKGFAIMSLAQYPSEATCNRLIALLGKRDDGGKGNLVLDIERDSPVRGFAALALGLYARPYNSDQGAADRPGFDRAIITLAERLEDANEDQEVRSACALALGLAQRTVVLPVLHRTGEAVNQRGRKQDLPILGFVMLGSALAGDQSVVDKAGKFVLGEDDTSPAGIIARRAAVLALGVSRSALAIPVLTKAWHLNHYVNREVIVALRLVGASGAAQPIMQRLRESNDVEERAYMAQALGELLAVDHPPTMTRLTANGNYTIRNDKLLPLQRLANGYLFDYLIASLGEEW